ncbi:TonB-dependent siderophore receptor [Thioalkalivibrio sp. ALJ15]|uniref:TonB-dependent receptor plug domain-containing protein n=1 Tax=Thioalkalivibrio sp. ALJ15 TaxID=748652 RepID=UPI0003A0D804|nr:TonB-dependent receptor [Thioalkalivibrio sp. ALJ15]
MNHRNSRPNSQPAALPVFPRTRKPIAALAALGLIPGVFASVAADTLDTSGAETPRLDDVVVTSSRTGSAVSDEPQAIQVISEEEIEKTAANDLTDLLKKRAGVDVVQYPGMLSGIGMRGFRPQFSGINQRTLLLYDDRPAGATNLSLISPSGIERIEVLRGPASSVYGSSAMAGVVNVIPRRKTGPWESRIALGYGSFDTREAELVTGGSANERTDITLGLGAREQRDDFRMGSGDRRDNTSFSKYDASLHAGTMLTDGWWLDMSLEGVLARDVESPGDIAYGTDQQGQKDVDRYSGETRLTGYMGDHEISLLIYGAREDSTNMEVVDGAPEYRSSRNVVDWRGVQIKDTWQWGNAHRLTFGMDHERAEQRALRWDADGNRIEPNSADSRRETTGLFARQQSRLPTDTVLTVGARHDWIKLEMLDTPHGTDFEPDRSRFTSFNPSIGASHPLGQDWYLRGSAGTAFIVPDAGAITGQSERQTPAGQTEITRGNPDLDPEKSFTWDIGVDYFGGPMSLHATYYNTRVRDRVVRVTREDPADPSEPRIFSFENADRARFEGLELETRYRHNEMLTLFGNVNHILTAWEEADGEKRDSLNVATWNVNAGIDLDFGQVDGQILARYVGPRKDEDWVHNPGEIVEDGGFTLVDLSAGWEPTPDQRLSITIENALDRDYFEKRGFPLAGRTITARYRYEF